MWPGSMWALLAGAATGASAHSAGVKLERQNVLNLLGFSSSPAAAGSIAKARWCIAAASFLLSCA